MRTKLAADLSSIQTRLQSGGLADSIVNQGLPASFDIQVSSNDRYHAVTSDRQGESCQRFGDIEKRRGNMGSKQRFPHSHAPIAAAR